MCRFDERQAERRREPAGVREPQIAASEEGANSRLRHAARLSQRGLALAAGDNGVAQSGGEVLHECLLVAATCRVCLYSVSAPPKASPAGSVTVRLDRPRRLGRGSAG